MLAQLALILLALALPLLAGFALARLKPAMPGFRAGLLAAIPFLLAFLVFAWMLTLSVPEGTESPYALASLLVWGTVAASMGFGLGFFGHSLGRKGAR